MTPPSPLDRAAALLLVLLVALTTLVEWQVPAAVLPRALVAAAVVLLLAPRVRASRFAFVAVGAGLTLWTLAVTPDWQPVLARGLASAGFIGAFFCALATLRSIAQSSPAIAAAGRYLASQPPGRRYLALSLGGHMFSLLLSYGAIALLGGLATTAAALDSDPVVRGHRRRRMLLAIQRGFISTLPWSPLSFAMAITTVLIPGASWRDAVLPGLVSALILAGLGWALDTLFKPRLAVRPPPRPVEGTFASQTPLFGLLALLAVSVGGLHLLTGVRIVGVVMLVVPLISLGWALLQHRGAIGPPLRQFLFTDLPGYRGEIVLLMMAGYIGTLGAPLLVPILQRMGLDLGVMPPWLLLVALVWLVPVLGQLGMNPILGVTLIAPLIPAAESLGVSPAAVVTAICAGWAISGICSPFTATTILTGSFGGVSPLHVGLRWNGLFVLLLGVVLSLWALLYAFVLAPV
ncbi:hypothetical protein [Marinovum sp.]|uniref:hypothetical protein n=1 Tax=Marinovum sp. TaxID=2024839 RepID=UPI002B26C103|nr:hypothetical protein [Marinovum sp.]